MVLAIVASLAACPYPPTRPSCAATQDKLSGIGLWALQRQAWVPAVTALYTAAGDAGYTLAPSTGTAPPGRRQPRHRQNVNRTAAGALFSLPISGLVPGSGTCVRHRRRQRGVFAPLSAPAPRATAGAP